MSTQYLSLGQITDVHLELTSKCNALCPQCSRVYQDKLNPNLPIGELSLEDLKKFLPAQICSHLKHVYLCGVYGDAAAAQSTLEILTYLREQRVSKLSLFSNGGLKNQEWWQQLATILNRPKDLVHFSIDGLEDTNHLYRKNVNWSKVITNATAFIQAGGKANWDFLVFAHNEHQIEEARSLSKELGFIDFRVKHTSRFIGDTDSSVGLASKTVSDQQPQLQPASMQSGSRPLDQIQALRKQHENLDHYFASTAINCKSKELKSIFISFDGRLWPCCWTASNFYHPEMTPKRKDILKLIEIYGPDFNSLHQASLSQLLESNWYSSGLSESWSNNFDHPSKPRLRACAQQCGKAYSAVSTQLDPQTRATKRL